MSTAVSTAAESIWVRVKPYNPKRGYKQKIYSVFGYRFHEGRGWYKLNKTMIWGEGVHRKTVDIAEYLRKIHNNSEDEQSPFVFDVCTEAEATAITAAEKKRAEKAAEPNDPIVDLTDGGGDLTSRDVRVGTTKGADDDEGDLAPAAASAAQTRGRGRPPGSKNKAKTPAPAAEG